MQTFVDYLAPLSREDRQARAASVTSADVAAVLQRDTLRPEDFFVLLSPPAQEYLEAMARRSQAETLRYFGRAVNLFTPLYVSDYCTNQCRYCGFNARNDLQRCHLSVDEAEIEARVIAASGLGHVLLLTGDARKLSSPEYIAAIAKRIKPMFASVGVEVYSMTEDEYRLLLDNGVDSMTMFQETYNPELYAWLHPVGPKSDYTFRCNAPGRAASAGMRSVGIGALLGLDNFIHDAYLTGLHANWLQNTYPGTDVAVSVPRMCPHEGSFEVKHTVDDRQFVQYITALRCFLPRVTITVSTRENATMRDNLIPLGVTRISAGVSTAVGGRELEQSNDGQFEISDLRSVEAVIADLASLGYQAVCKDWESPELWAVKS